MSTATNKPDFYVSAEEQGTFTAYVKDKGFRAHVPMMQALAFIREQTGLTGGAVPCWDEHTQEWDSELELDIDAQ
jgi:hypothetical protein